jgi:hypothetical protein
MALQFAKTLIRLADRFGDGRLTGVGRLAPITSRAMMGGSSFHRSHGPGYFGTFDMKL